jgi:hypothetical protein
MDRTVLKEDALRFSADFAHPSHVRGSLSVDAILYKIWDMINQFPDTVHTVQTSGSGIFFNPILLLPIPLTHHLASKQLALHIFIS